MSILGVLPAVGSGLDTMARAGQLGRLTEYMRAWGTGFGHATYFSYLDWSVEQSHARLLQQAGRDVAVNACVAESSWPWHRALRRPILAHQREHWRGLTVLRAMNLLAALPALTANVVWRTPFVVSLGADYEAIARIHGDIGQVKKWRFLRALVLRRATAVIVPNPVQAARLSARWANIIALPNWVDLDHFHPFPFPFEGKDRRYFAHGTECDTGIRWREGCPILYVGRLVKEKNLPRFAHAVRGTGAVLVCVGAGPEAHEIEAAGGVVCGTCDWTELPELLGRAWAFALPSLSEGHPKALLEALACGLPCLVSDRVEGVVEHERTALVFGAEDESSMRAAVERLLREPALASRLGQAARAEAEARYAKGPILAQEVALLGAVRRN